MKAKFLVFCFLIPFLSVFAQTKEWKLIKGKVFFKSETDLETILGEGDSVIGSLDLNSKKIIIQIELGKIKTENKLQTSHLHDNYFEIDKYPIATFEGLITEIKEEGEVEAVGFLDLHGKKKENLKITGKLQKKENGTEQLSYFTINLSDHNIEIPKMVFLKVNPLIQVKVKLLWETR